MSGAGIYAAACGFSSSPSPTLSGHPTWGVARCWHGDAMEGTSATRAWSEGRVCGRSCFGEVVFGDGIVLRFLGCLHTGVGSVDGAAARVSDVVSLRVRWKGRSPCCVSSLFDSSQLLDTIS